LSVNEFLNYGIAGVALYLLYLFIQKLDGVRSELVEIKLLIREICERVKS